MESYIRQHKIYPDEFPESWASGWGEDEFGLWMAFTYKGVSQKFRWCEPGTFTMGSPILEPGREGNEAQHEITLSKGFWLADTTVTQSLWEVVTGKKPSHFKGENLPVDNISWGDTQKFISKMNDMKLELKLRLPTEAQWEYACRAGGTSPFCWGNQINSELVNFNDKLPHNSNYRKKTVDVESFYQNDWGLWQMHGNVWEWCQDWYAIYPEKNETDPTRLEAGDFRVLRGGSWFNFSSECRSAYRGPCRSDSRYYDVGFRLARSY